MPQRTTLPDWLPMSGTASDQRRAATCDPIERSIAARAGRLPLIGREEEVAQLRSAIDAALSGEPRVVLLAGEAGIGKTRLLDEAMRMMADGVTALGRCVDERGLPPFLPWIDALADLDDRAGHQFTAPRMQDLLLDANVADADPHLAGGPSPELRKLRLFDRITRALADLARAAPLLLAFDDLQWSDDASNELLRYVALHLPLVPLVIVGAYRVEETAANPGLQQTIADLHRRRLLITIRVDPLTAEETAHLFSALVGEQHANLAPAIYRHSEGNPFYIEEVVRALTDEVARDSPSAAISPAALPAETIPLPQSVVAVIQRRLERVSAP